MLFYLFSALVKLSRRELKMALLSSLSDLEGTSNSLIMNERARLDTADTCACPTTAELSKAVSVSLGLDTVSSPLSSMNLGSSSSFADFPAVENSSRGVPELKAARNILLNDINLRGDDFGEVCHGIQQVSCMDLLRSGEMESAESVTRGPVISRYLCQESNLFTNPVAELPAPSQVDDLSSLRAYSAYSGNQNLYRDTPGMWCAQSGRSELERAGSGGLNLLCKYCNCGQASLGSRQECHCVWHSKREQGGKGGMLAAMAQGYGQVESCQSAIPQGQDTFSTIKTEPSIWVDCTDRSFR